MPPWVEPTGSKCPVRGLKFLLPHVEIVSAAAAAYMGFVWGGRIRWISAFAVGSLLSSWFTFRYVEPGPYLPDPPLVSSGSTRHSTSTSSNINNPKETSTDKPVNNNNNNNNINNNTNDTDEMKNKNKNKNKKKKIGVLHINLGTPDSRAAVDVGDFLQKFLGDRRVVETPRILWWCILNLIILPVRSFTSAVLYSRVIVKKETAPLLAYSLKLTEKLREKLGPSFVVELGMINGQPSIQWAIERLKEQDVDRIVVFSAFPQYSGTTTGSLCDHLFQSLSLYRNVPSIHVIPPYYDHPSFVAAIAKSIAAAPVFSQWDKTSPATFHLLFSFHGIPVKYCTAGDPYPFQCEATAAAVANELGLKSTQWSLSYQSQFGYDKWLTPATTEHMHDLAQGGVKNLLVACPGFLVDCLETIDEIGSEAKHGFIEAGGAEYHFVPCLNDTPLGVDAVSDIILQESGSWLSSYSS